MPVRHRAILDQIQQVKDQFGPSPLEYEHVKIEREVVLGMKFRRGDHVKDQVTGLKGQVVAGYRRQVPKAGA